jgi:rSAM/selenodomain-associated transferase 2
MTFYGSKPMTEPNSISIIIPVLREGEGINHLLSAIPVGSGGFLHEIIVVDGDPARDTIKKIKDCRVITTHAKQGRASQMNRGASLASGEILLFLHADTRLPPNAFIVIRNALIDHRIVGGCFSLGIDSDRGLFRVTEHYVSFRTWLTRVPFGDQAIFLRREFFEQVGRYADIPIMEDVELMTRIRRNKGRICILPDRVMTSSRRWEKEGVVFATFRNWTLQLLFCAGVTPNRLARWYRS